MTRIFTLYVSRCAAFLAMADAVLIAAAVAGGIQFALRSDAERTQTLWSNAAQLLAIAAAFQISFYYNELYDIAVFKRPLISAARLGQSLGAGCIVLGIFYWAMPALTIERGAFVVGLLLAGFSAGMIRVAVWRWCARRPAETIAIIGTGDLAQTVAQEIDRRADLRLKIVGLVDEDPWRRYGSLQLDREVLGSTKNLLSIADHRRFSRIILAIDDNRRALPIRDLVSLRVQGIVIEEAVTALAALTGRVWLRVVRPSWFVFSGGFRRSKTTLMVKRITDVLLAVIGIVVVAPFVPLIALAIRLDSRGPVLYRQTRVGYNGVPFELLKFRSMYEDAERSDGACWAQESDPRSTRVGRFLRRSRIDELPQFWNVFRGEMSFVGPRPERPEFVDQLRREIPYYEVRHSVRPGITGWAQVRYRYAASIDDAERKLEYDLFYLKNLSIAFDALIVFETVQIMLFGRGAR